MLLFLLAYLGGVLTITSPCILPVLPFVFTQADRPFIRSGLPMVIGMAVTFAVIATLAAIAGGWAVAANQFGRTHARAPRRLRAGAAPAGPRRPPHTAIRRTRHATAAVRRRTFKAAAIRHLSVASYRCCDRPALGSLRRPGAGPGPDRSGIAGRRHRDIASASRLCRGSRDLARAGALGRCRVVAAMKRSFGAGEWIRRALGVAVLAAVAAIAVGLDTGFLTRLSLADTTSLEQGLLNRFQPQRDTADKQDDLAMKPSVVMQNGPAAMAANPAMIMKAKPAAGESVALPDEGTLPSLDGAGEWLNGPPLTATELRGKVVLIDFWTYSCINCLRAIPYVRAWAEKYRDQGLVVVGVHAPEFAFEKSLGNVKKAVADLGITYPVALDNNYSIWRAFNNQYWPAHYFVDTQGHIRHHHFGEGDYDDSERVIQQLLAEAGRTKVPTGAVAVKATGVPYVHGLVLDARPRVVGIVPTKIGMV